MIGVLGGTFDPIHCGHLRVALDVQRALALDEVRLLPLNQAVHRPQPIASPEQRMAMIRAAIAGEPQLVVDDRELRRGGQSYTVETLESLRAELGPTRPIGLLIGADAFNAFLDWHRPMEILSLAHLIVMQRPRAEMPRNPILRDELQVRSCASVEDLRAEPAGRIWMESVTQLDISATGIRRLCQQGASLCCLTPVSVADYIRRHHLYQEPKASAAHSATTA